MFYFFRKEKILHCKGGETLGKAAWRSCGCPIPGAVQGLAGWGFEVPALVEGFLPMAGALELDGLYDPFQTEPFCGSAIRSKLGLVQ